MLYNVSEKCGHLLHKPETSLLKALQVQSERFARNRILSAEDIDLNMSKLRHLQEPAPTV